jgi:hypothetical protein
MPNETDGLSHKDFVLDRAKKIDTMFQAIEGDENLRKSFFKDPQQVADGFEISLSHEETFAIRSMKRVGLANLRERLVLSKVGFFDGNCGCALFGPGGVLTRAVRPGL